MPVPVTDAVRFEMLKLFAFGDLTARDLEIRLGYSRRRWREIFFGRRDPSLNDMIDLAHAYGREWTFDLKRKDGE
jgi:transcriptional regulator with XRE-family HTH domain